MVHPFRMPLDVIALGAIVEFSFGDAEVQRKQVRHPHDVQSSADVSVASPTGSGLIGMEAGQCISWPDEHGVFRDLQVQSVSYAAGGIHLVDPGLMGPM